MRRMLFESIRTIHTRFPFLLPLIALIVLSGEYYLARHTTVFAPPFNPTSDAYIDAVGPIQAQETALELRRKNLLTTNGHLYLHEIGEYIYGRYGPAGAKYCTPYFDNACYNGFTMHLDSVSKLKEVLAACGAVSRKEFLGCIHGAGHAALSISDYDVPNALHLCDTLAANDASAVHACTFGVFMENAFPHVRANRTGNTRWQLKKSDPFFPCDDPRIAKRYERGCWRMQGVVLTNTMSAPEVVGVCDAITDDEFKRACFEGFSDGYGTAPFNAKNILSICGAANGNYWGNICITDFVTRVYLNGFDTSTARALCSRIDASGKDLCEQTTVEMEQQMRLD